ncbi:MAG: S8 family serine peptidase, partial [Kiritimatiellae bacterium]|nr:S8 family serine peptidase [Kiritimatiellia bacterium]
LLQWGTIDTASDAAQAESAALKAKVAKKAAAARKAGAAAESRAAYVVQFPGPVADEWRAWLESATQVRGYLPEFAYLVWATPSEMDAIAANPDVFWTGEWKKEYKTVCAETAPAKTTASAAADEARWMQVGSLLTGDDGAADLRARLEALPATVRSAFPRLDGSSAVAFLTDAQIEEVASWPDVEWIEPKLKARLFNDKAARTNMMNVTNAWKALSSGGLGLTGTNQIVAVADTGCDKGSLTDIHADFAGRVKAGYGWADPDPDDYEGGVYSASYSWADTDAHGTHVCGSVLGSGAKSSGQFRGMAYEAQLVMQGCQEDLSGLPDYTWDLLKQAYTAGARIHSDSWGFGTNYAGKYIYDAAYSDGYMWTNQNFIMVIAAGNDGIDKNKDGVIDAGSVSCPGTAKNCLCVGAAENYRSTGGYSEYGWGSAWSSDYPTDPIKSDKISQTSTPQGLAAFSGRGPTKDGRFKPDIVAPGTDVISVRSRMAQDDGWGIYTSNTNYLYEGGTSMATPLTSGALALVRQWLVDRKGINEPMAALMKALLINGARDMTPGQYGTGSTQEITARPDRSQGFGHVNLYNSLEPGDGNFLVFAT